MLNLVKKMAFFTFLILLCSCGRKTSDIISSASNDSPNQEISSESTTIQWGSHGGNALANNVVAGQLPNQLNHFGTYNESGGAVHAAPVIYTDHNSDQIIFTLFATDNDLSLHKITVSANGGIHEPTIIEIQGLSTDEQHYKAHQLALGDHNDQLALYITDLSNGLTKINAVNGNVIETKKISNAAGLRVLIHEDHIFYQDSSAMHKINALTFEIEDSISITSHKERALPLVISQNNLYVVSESSIECYTIDAFSSCGSEAFATGEKISNMAAYSDTVIYSTIREVSVFDDNATIHTTEFKKFGTTTFEPLLNYKQARDAEINGETYGFIGDSKHTSLTIHEDNAYLPGINTNRLLTWPDLIVSQNVTLDLTSRTPFTRTLNNDASKQSQNGQITKINQPNQEVLPDYYGFGTNVYKVSRFSAYDRTKDQILTIHNFNADDLNNLRTMEDPFGTLFDIKDNTTTPYQRKPELILGKEDNLKLAHDIDIESFAIGKELILLGTTSGLIIIK